MVQETEKGPAPSARGRFRSWSLAKKLVAGFLAVCAAVGSIGGAVKLGVEVVQAIQKHNAAPSDFDRTPVMGLQFWQDDKQRPMKEDDASIGHSVVTVDMAPGPFHLWFPGRPADQPQLAVCAWTDDSVFAVQPDQALENTTCFGPGHGIATTEFTNGTLYLELDGFNYFIDTRIEKTGTDDYWKVYISRTAKYPAQPVPLAHATTALYLTALVDANGDGVAQSDEFEFIHLAFH